MVSMNIKDDDAPTTGAIGSADYDNSPTIYLSDDQCEALGITGMPKPGTVYMLRVKAVVIRVTATQEEKDEVKAEGDAPDLDVSLRLTDMEILNGGEDNTASLLYGS